MSAGCYALVLTILAHAVLVADKKQGNSSIGGAFHYNERSRSPVPHLLLNLLQGSSGAVGFDGPQKLYVLKIELLCCNDTCKPRISVDMLYLLIVFGNTARLLVPSAVPSHDSKAFGARCGSADFLMVLLFAHSTSAALKFDADNDPCSV